MFKNSSGETVSLPSTFKPGETLPAVSGTEILVSVESSYANVYEFTGWYNNPEATGSPVAKVPDTASEPIPLYAGIKVKSVTITFSNTAYTEKNNETIEMTVYFYAIENNEERRITPANNRFTMEIGHVLPGSESGICVGIDEEQGHYYEFDGWYTTAAAAKSHDSSKLVTVAQPNPDAEPGNFYPQTYYPAVKGRYYTLKFENTFPQAGELVIPTSIPSDSKLTYSHETENGKDVVVISGFEYGDSFTLPIGPVYNSSPNANELHIESYGTKYAYSGLSDRDDLNLALYLMEEQEYVDSRTDYNAYNYYPGEYEKEASITINEDKTFYLYFSINVSIEALGLTVKESVLNWSVGKGTEYISVDDIITDSDQEPVVKLLDDVESDGISPYDQYWRICRTPHNYEVPGIILSTSYFGKQIDVPSIFAEGSDGTEIATKAQVIGADTEGNFLQGPWYANDVKEASAVKTAYTLKAASFTDAIPFLNDNNKFVNTMIEFSIDASEYAILDLGDADSFEIGDDCGFVAREKTSTESNLIRLVSPYTFMYHYPIPLDAYNSYADGHDLTTDSTYQSLAKDNIMVKKQGYKIIGFEIWESGEIKERTMIGLEQGSDVVTGSPTSADPRIELNTENLTSGSNLVIKPIFAPNVLFTVNLVRAADSIVKPTGSDAYWARSGYYFEISGPGVTIPEEGNPTVTYIDLGYIEPEVYCGYTTSKPFKAIVWNGSVRKYQTDENNPVQIGVTNGKIRVSLESMFNTDDPAIDDWYTSINFIKGLRYFVETHDNLSHYGEKGIEFKYFYDDDGYCWMSPDNPESDYKPFKYYKADFLAGSNKFTAIDNREVLGSPVNITAVFSEKDDTFATGLRALRAFGGYGDDNKKIWHGARLYEYSGRYGDGSRFYETLLKDDVGGTAARIINGNAGPGHGILCFEPINYMIVAYNSDMHGSLDNFKTNILTQMNVYDVRSYKLENDHLSDRQGVVNPSATPMSTWQNRVDQAMGLYLPIQTESVTVGEDSIDITQLPEGWTLLKIDGETYYFNYANYASLNVQLRPYSEARS
ncbi:MAG: hypothetical protein IK138_02640 [Lachnospiraceae bacterium]|nr:hypothetical protein [Lachnospiraceae bacterium]